jgi:uncharacterized protein YbdZ (MbtH family)
MKEDKDPFDSYAVVINHEEQYSIWPIDRELPSGWRALEFHGTKEACLNQIEEDWTDMRPLSLRMKMEELAKNPPKPSPPPSPDYPKPKPLADQLSHSQSVEILIRPETTPARLKERLEEVNYLHLVFTGTRGGTELGVEVDLESSDWSSVDFEAGVGKFHLEGDLTLDFVPVRCYADLDVATMSGEGRLARK